MLSIIISYLYKPTLCDFSEHRLKELITRNQEKMLKFQCVTNYFKIIYNLATIANLLLNQAYKKLFFNHLHYENKCVTTEKSIKYKII